MFNDLLESAITFINQVGGHKFLGIVLMLHVPVVMYNYGNRYSEVSALKDTDN